MKHNSIGNSVAFNPSEMQALGFDPQEVAEWPLDRAADLRDHAAFMRDMWRTSTEVQPESAQAPLRSRAGWANCVSMIMDSVASGEDLRAAAVRFEDNVVIDIKPAELVLSEVR